MFFALARRLTARFRRTRRHSIIPLAILGLALLAGPAQGAAPFVSGETLPGTVVWRGDYENGFSGWTGMQEVTPDKPPITDQGASNGSCSRGSFSGEDRLRIVSSPVRQGSFAARAVVHNGDRPICSSGNRTEHMRPNTNENEGDENYYRWSVMLAPDFPRLTTYQLITQWHGAGGGNQAPVRIDVYNDSIRFITVESNEGNDDNWRTHWTAPANRGMWHDFIAHIKWSYNRSVGFVELWHRLEGEANYSLVVPRTFRRTLVYSSSGVYLKGGYYRGANAGAAGVVYLDGWTQTRVTGSQSPPPPSPTPPPPAGQAPFNTALPTISGTAQEGRQLTASNGSWSNSPTGYTRQWRRCSSAGTNCGAINGATASTYTVSAADVGSRLQVAVTATNPTGSSTSTSASTAVVTGTSEAPPAPAPSGSFTVTSTIAESQTLSGITNWRATVSGTTTSNIAQVDFLVDGARVLTEYNSPYGDTVGFLDTRTMANGVHAFSVRATARNGGVATSTVNASVANGSGSGGTAPPPPPQQPPTPAPSPGADMPNAQVGATVTDPGCTGCGFGTSGSELEATIAGGADSVDTAYGVVDLGGNGWDGRVWTRDVVRVPSSPTLGANLAIYQVRDANDALVYELYIDRGDRTIRLWSPAGGLRSSSINMSTGVTAESARRVEVSALRNESVVVRVDGADRVTVSNLSGASTQNQRFIRAGIDHYDTNTSTETIRAYHSMLGATTAGWLESRTSPLSAALLKARAHRASAKAKDAAHTKSKAAKAHRAGKAKASDAKATQNKRHKVAKAPKVIPAGPLATKSPATRVAVDISKRPQTLKGGRIAVQGQASPGAAVTIVVRDARGRILGLGKSKATARGFFFEPVSLRAWKGQGFLKVTASAVRFNDMRRTSFGASLSQAERKQLASG